MTNEEYIRNAFTDEELANGVWNNWDGRGNILTRKFIDLLKDKISFDDVKVILDIGSRDGLQSLEFNRWFPNAKILAFEPIKSSFDFIKNITANVENITAYPYAANSYFGKTKFYEVYNGNVGASSLLQTSSHPRAQSWAQKEIEVECIHLSQFLTIKGIHTVDLIWMDVQGAEKIVLNSLMEHLPNVKAIATEAEIQILYNGASDKTELDKLLTDFICVDATPESSHTEMDVIYINKKFMQ